MWVTNNSKLQGWLKASGHGVLALSPGFAFKDTAFQEAKAEVVRQHPEETNPDSRAAFRLLTRPKIKPGQQARRAASDPAVTQTQALVSDLGTVLGELKASIDRLPRNLRESVEGVVLRAGGAEPVGPSISRGLKLGFGILVLLLLSAIAARSQTVVIRDEGTLRVRRAGGQVGVDFVGAGVSCAPNVAGIVTCTISGGAATGYDTIEEEGTPLTQRTVLNFTGVGVTCVDDIPGLETDCDIPGGAADGVGYDEVMEEAVGLVKRAIVNFIGANMTCVDNPGSSRTDCTVSGAGGNLDLLDGATHQDTAAGTAVRGDIITVPVSGLWTRFPIGGVDTILGSDGTDPSWETSTGTSSPVRANNPLFPDRVRFTAIAAPAHSAGQFFYDSGNESVTFHNNEADIALQIGQEMWIRVRNESGSTITNGQVVYIDGLASGLPRVALARADVAATAEAVGLATHDIETASSGFVTAYGLVRDFDTSAFVLADRVYLSATGAGLLTNTAPSDPNFVVPIGIVTEVNATTGDVFVTLAPPRPTGGAGIQISGNTVSTLSSEEDFLVSGALGCGLNTRGRMQVHTTPLQYCDNAATPLLQFAAYAASDGDALAGDDADSFFDAGTIGVVRGGTNLASGTDGGILGYTAPGTLASSALLTANALVLGGGAGATPSTPVGLGTVTTLLHGNVAGAPSYSAVDLANDVTGVLASGSYGAASIDSDDVAIPLKTFDKSIVVIDPTTGEDDKVQWMHGKAVTYTDIDCSTDAGTTVTIDMDHRVITTPNTVGTDIITGTIVCDDNNQSESGFADATIPANVPVNLSITAVSGTPGTVRIHVRGTVDP